MTYEPKVGDEVIVRGKVAALFANEARVYFGGEAEGYFPFSILIPVPDAGEAEMRGEVTGPWAVALSETMEKIEARVAELEASAKVRDVPATMVNLASRVQGLETANKIWVETLRERNNRVNETFDNLQHRLRTVEAVLEMASENPEKPLKTEFLEVRDAQGRVLKSKTDDVDPQADWNTARVVAPDDNEMRRHDMLVERARAAEKMTETIRDANTVLTRDVQRAEARLDRIGSFMRGRERSLVKDEILRILEDPAHGAHAQAPE